MTPEQQQAFNELGLPKILSNLRQEVTWREKYMRDPELADSIITALRSDLAEAEKRIEVLTYALERIQDIEWSQYSNQIDAIQQLAKHALQ